MRTQLIPKRTPEAITVLPLINEKPIPKNFPIDKLKPGQSFLWKANKKTVIPYLISYKRKLQNKGILVNFKVISHDDGVRIWRTL